MKTLNVGDKFTQKLPGSETMMEYTITKVIDAHNYEAKVSGILPVTVKAVVVDVYPETKQESK